MSDLTGLLAYIDPGAGSLLIQVVIGSILAVPYFLRTQISRVYRKLRRRASSDETDRSTQPPVTGA